MREICFRMWDKTANRYFTEPEQVMECLKQQLTGVFDHVAEGSVFEQYTGLRDKHGVKIFEGDIVEISHPCWSNRAVVKFLSGSFVFQSTDEETKGAVVPGYTFMKETWKVEVIGNVHQHTELLGG